MRRGKSFDGHVDSKIFSVWNQQPTAMISDFSLGYGYLPVCWALFTSFTFLLCYGIAVSLDHIYPFVPAISDTGARIPEANIFSEFFNFSLVLMVLSLFVRYLQFQMLTKGLDSADRHLDRFNKLGLGFGLVSAFGGSIIANFPSNEVCSISLRSRANLSLFPLYIYTKHPCVEWYIFLVNGIILFWVLTLYLLEISNKLKKTACQNLWAKKSRCNYICVSF